MTTFFLVRHGQNKYVGKGKLAGWLPGVHLDALGKAQAAALTEFFQGIKLQAVYSSPLERALETAEPLAESQGLEVIPRENLGEIHYGTWQGQSLKALQRRKLWPIIQHLPSLVRFPEGESFPEAQARIVSEVEHLRSQHKSPKAKIACVFHADPIKLVLAHYLGLPLDLFQRLVIEPASISVLQVSDQHVRLLGLNDTRATRAPTPE